MTVYNYPFYTFWFKLFFFITLCLAFSNTLSGQTPPAHKVPLLLWYKQPATLPDTLPYSSTGSTKPWDNKSRKGWVEALPIGNGKMGAMVFGGIERERIQLNEETLWDGHYRDSNNPNALQSLPEVRKLLFEEKSDSAVSIAKKTMLGIPKDIKSYQSMGDLFLDFEGIKKADVAEYYRDLNLENAVATVKYKNKSTQFTRECFSSHPANVTAVFIKASGKDKINVSLFITREKDASSLVDDNVLILRGQIKSLDEYGVNQGLKFETQVMPLIKGGSIKAEGNTLKILGADEVVLLIASSTNYRGNDPRETCTNTLREASKKTYQELKSEHIADHQNLFNRVSFNLFPNLVSDATKIPTDERLEKARKDSIGDDYLSMLQFQMGRYLLIASSRPGDLPANLQGIWNEHLNAPWESDYHTNINLQMNYWPAESTNLSECHLPLVDFIDYLMKYGEKTAKIHYNAKGWVVHHAADIFGFTAPMSGVWGIWPMGAAWLTRHSYEHYLYTGDKFFLKQRAFPQMKGAADFMLDFLVPIPKGLPMEGMLVTNPSHSPENAFINKSGVETQFGYGSTMDIEIIRDLFTNCLEAISILEKEDKGFEKEFKGKISLALKRLPPIQITKAGKIQEWIEDYEEVELGHRHLSPLYALYPDNEISLGKDSIMVKAALKTIEARLKGNPNQPKSRFGIFDPYLNGKGGTGWGRAWLSLLYSRLGKGEDAYRHHQILQSNFLLPNLLGIAHGTYQIDNVLGNTAAISEMLIQSHDGFINLLPAIPLKWAQGAVSGLKAIGGFEVSVEWKDHKLIKSEIYSSIGGNCFLKSQTFIKQVLCNGKHVNISRKEGNKIEFETKAKTSYILIF